MSELKNLRIKSNGNIKYITRLSDIKGEGEDIRIVRLTFGNYSLGTNYECNVDPQKRVTVTYNNCTVNIPNDKIFNNTIIIFTDKYRINPEVVSVQDIEQLKIYLKNKKKYTNEEIRLFLEVYVLEVIE